jgi:hypothetical protein
MQAHQVVQAVAHQEVQEALEVELPIKDLLAEVTHLPQVVVVVLVKQAMLGPPLQVEMVWLHQ